MQQTMKAALLQEYGNLASLVVSDVPVPQPQPGQVLIRMESAPINPSDLAFLQGHYGVRKALPAVPGFEGSGTVVANGGGLLGWNLVGSRVACVAGADQNGTWAEFMVTSAKTCIKLPTNVSFDMGACYFVNPLSCAMFIDIIKREKHEAVVQTAAASSLGKMLIRWCSELHIPVINVVRREEQVRSLREMGCAHVLNSSSPQFREELSRLCIDLNATVAFDAVGGEMTGMVMQALCENSVVYVYGALAGEACSGVHPGHLIFHSKRVEGLWLTEWIKTKGLFSMWGLTGKVMGLLPTILKTDISQIFSLKNIKQALDYYTQNMSQGKVILRLSGGSVPEPAE